MIKSIKMVVELSSRTKETEDDLDDILSVMCAKQLGGVVGHWGVSSPKGSPTTTMEYKIEFYKEDAPEIPDDDGLEAYVNLTLARSGKTYEDHKRDVIGYFADNVISDQELEELSDEAKFANVCKFMQKYPDEMSDAEKITEYKRRREVEKLKND